jgi:hypothetical protein
MIRRIIDFGGWASEIQEITNFGWVKPYQEWDVLDTSDTALVLPWKARILMESECYIHGI